MERRRPSRLELAEPMTKTVRRRERPRERWLLTRKTWKYMSDAGRRLIPDGAQNRLEDVPRLEVYFQEVCQKEPRFLLWRKSSYPGVLPKPRRKKRPRGGSVRARSPSDDVALSIARPSELYIPHTSGGRFDIAKLRRDFFAAPAPSVAPAPRPSTSLNNGCSNASEDEGVLVDLLRKYLKLEDEKTPAKVTESEELVSALRNYLKKHSDRRPADSDSDPTQRILREHLNRYHSGSSNRDNIVQDLLSDRNSLRSLYHDLRKPKPYRGGRSGGYGGGGGYGSSGVGAPSSRSGLRSRVTSSVNFNDNYSHGSPKSPPPLIEVFGESLEERPVDVATQTLPIPEEVLAEIERQYREKVESATAPTSPTSPPNERRPRRRSSVDHDDVSQSVSDTIKRYLRMARKKSVDAEKTDRFKRINYDKNLRNIKPRPPNEVDDDGFHKGCQTDEAWIMSYRDVQFASVASTPTSPLSPTQSHSFLSTLLGKNAAVSAPSGAMQKSRSSSSVVQSVGKRLWRTRSRSSSRAVATWTPQGSCVWADGAGRQVRLADTSLLSLSEVERRALQQAALARLKELHLGTIIKIPEENATAVTTKPKRRAHLLKRKALTTSFFDQSRTKDGDKDKESSGSVFGVPLTQCVEAERALRRQHGGSRVSLASLSGLEKGDDSDTCDSGECLGLEDGEGCPKVPKIVSACLAHLRRHGLRTRGLFRVSASIKRVRQLREEWESGVESALDGAVCPHDVATLLKEFLRDLPDPLLCRDLYPAFLSTQKIRNPKLQWEALRLLVHLLPAAHRDTLHALLSFLSLLASHCADDVQASKEGNMMNAANIATIFAPNILHKNKGNEAAGSEQLSERTDVIDVVRTLVERQAELWTLPAELLHEAYVHLAHSAPAQLDALLLHRADCAAESVSPTSDSKRVWTREALLHTDTATQLLMNRELLHDYNSTVLTARSSGTQDSNDSASDYNEAGVTSEDECVITASLRIPGVRARRRSTSGSSSGKRDSAVGSSAPSPSPASPASSTSPPASPPHAPPRLVALGRERITSDARAVAVRQHDESVTRSRTTRSQEQTRHEPVKSETRLRRDERREDRREDNLRRDAVKKEDLNKEKRTIEGQLYFKRGELISSTWNRPA